MSRRLLALTFAAGLCATAARAEDIVVGAFGGSFVKSVEACHIEPFKTATGTTVSVKLGNSSQFAAMIRATAGQSDLDVVYIDDSLATLLASEGLLEKIDVSKLSSAAQLVPGAVGANGYFVQYQWSATLIAYNPTIIKTPPTSWADLFKPDYAGKIALPDISGTAGVHFLLATNRLYGGDIENLDKGYSAIKAMTPGVAAFYTQPDQLISMFQRGEVVIAPWYPDRAAVAAEAGAPIAIAYPKEGAVGIKVTMVIPKGAKHPAEALKYIDGVLSAGGQSCFADRQYAGPVNTAATLSDKARNVVPPEKFGTLYFPPAEVIARDVAQWRQRWQREITR